MTSSASPLPLGQATPSSTPTPTPMPPTASPTPTPTPVAVATSAAAASSMPSSLCSCPHLNTYLDAQPQPPLPPLHVDSARATNGQTNNTNANGSNNNGNSSKAATDVTGMDVAMTMETKQAEDEMSELQAIIHYAATIDAERKGMGRHHRPMPFPRCSDAVNASPPSVSASSSSSSAHSASTCCLGARSLMACIQCVHVGCWTPVPRPTTDEGKDKNSSNSSNNGMIRRHAKVHAEEQKHDLALDMNRLAIYCFACNDYAYHPTVEQLVKNIKHDVTIRKRRRDESCSVRAAALALTHSSSSSGSGGMDPETRIVGADSLAGLRGMYNLGNTCFLSVVLQSLLHNPLLRNYFLSDLHNPHRCVRRASGSATFAVCLGCDLDELFAQHYFPGEQAQDRTPVLPDQFLFDLWMHAEHLAGYAQQDAHECLMAILDALHTTCCDTANTIATGQTLHATSVHKPCKCVVHTVFGGTLRSDVSCNTCGTTSTAMDAMLDISLDLVAPTPNNPTTTDTTSSHVNTPQPPAPPTKIDPRQTFRLVDCLSRFIRVEKLFHQDKFYCSKCGRHENSTKQLSIQSLPLVLCLHLKRFDHSARVSAASSKIDNYVTFPLTGLDLSPYLHSHRTTPLSPPSSSRSQPESSSMPSATRSHHQHHLYDCFCVIVHKGTLDSGHYIAYLRKGPDQWFKTDDRTITRASIQEVINANAYLLFYIRQRLPPMK